MKKFFLSLLLLQAMSDVQAKLTKEEKALVVGGAATGLSCLWFWGRESNSVKINRAYKIYNSCRSVMGQHEQYLTGDPEVMLQRLSSSPILQRADEIISSCSELKGRNAWFWNKSDELYEACHIMKRLKRSLDDYEFVKKQLSQQVLVKHIEQLWIQLSHCNVQEELSSFVNANTLKQLQQHHVVIMQQQIMSLDEQVKNYKKYKEILCAGFEQACDRIVKLADCLRRYSQLIKKIQTYESITNTYGNILLLNLDRGFGAQNLVLEARTMGSCNFAASTDSYPLMNFVQNLKSDITTLKNLKLNPSYVRVNNTALADVKYSTKGALQAVVQQLEKVLIEISSSHAYQDELRRKEEQRIYEERMRLERERLRLERERLRAEQDRVEAEKERAKLELERARGQRYKNSTEAELDRAYDQQEGQQKIKQSSTAAELDAAYAEQERRRACNDYNSWW